MRMAIDLPEALLARALTLAASRGTSVEAVVTEALEEHLRRCGEAPLGRGELADLADENRRILELIEEEFGP